METPGGGVDDTLEQIFMEQMQIGSKEESKNGGDTSQLFNNPQDNIFSHELETDYPRMLDDIDSASNLNSVFFENMSVIG